MSVERNAKLLIVPANLPGKIVNALAGTAEKLIRRGQISSHHRIATADGIEIDVWVIRSRQEAPAADNPPGPPVPRRTAVLLHGLLCGKGWFLKLGGMLADMGWDVVLPDLRAHGDSGGQYITWGAKEKHDLKAVMDRLVADGVVSERIYVLGSSMGGAVAILYAAIDPRCRGVMALAPPQSARAICQRILLPHSPKNFEAALALASNMAGFDPADASAEAAAANLHCPLLLVHGIWDFIVPYDHSKAILRAAREPKRLVPNLLRGHSVEFFNEREIIMYFEQMEAMSPSPVPRPQKHKYPWGVSGLGIASILLGLSAAGGISLVSGGRIAGFVLLGMLAPLLGALLLGLAALGATLGTILASIGLVRAVARRSDSVLPIIGLVICAACILLNGRLFQAAWMLLTALHDATTMPAK